MVGDSQAKRLERALAELSNATTPTDRLHAIRRLRDAMEKLERAHIDAARSAGMTWNDIGTAYGLSKQGAQQKFRKRPKSK